MTGNTALRLNCNRAAFTVAPAPYTEPREGEVLLRVRAMVVTL